MTDHCFISYSNADAADFATKLSDELEGGHPFINVWFDKRDLRSEEDWRLELADAIKTCKCMFFIMTQDSVLDNSTCAEEWDWALRYKKPVVPLRLHTDIQVPFGLGRRQWIDFSSNYEAGLAKLRKYIAILDSPEGVLQALNDRFKDAERDLKRANKPESESRIKAELEELTDQIKRQEEIVKNPKAAEEKTEKNIQSGLERERQPERPVAGKTSTRFINPPPGIAPTYFKDRDFENKEIVKFLNNDAQRLLTIVGRAGVGKTAMVCRLLKALERGELPDDLGEMKTDGIVYLSETGSHRVNFANVFADLSKLLPRETAERLEGMYKNPQTSTGDKMRALLDAFPSGRVILLLDNFENLIGPESLNLRDSELSEALNALLGGQHHAVKAVITTRIAPRDLAINEPGRQHHLSLDEGLESPYAENVLREMDADGRVGLKSAPDALLNKAREKTRGYPRALEALYAILSVDRYTTLEELLEISLPDEVVQKLVGEAFNRLDPSAQKVMQALAVYNRPVSPAAIDYLLQPHLRSIDSALVLNRLVNMHFARREAGRYYLHPADKEYAFSIIPEKDLTTKDTKVTKENQEELTAKTAKVAKEDLELLFESSHSLRTSRSNAFTQHDLLNRAADYFTLARKPRAEWKKLDDLAAQLAEFDLRCAAGDYDSAGDILSDFDFDYLKVWGHFRLLIKYYESLQGKLTQGFTKNRSLNELGMAYYALGDLWRSIKYYEEALTVVREEKDQTYEGVLLGNLGSVYIDIGDFHKAVEFSEQALVIARKVYDRANEGRWLGNLGELYSRLGENEKSSDYYHLALQNAREINNRFGETKRLNGLADVSIAKGDIENAINYSRDAMQIGQEINSPELCIESGSSLAQAYLFQNDLVNARTAIEAALQYDVPPLNHNTTALHGIIALRQGERETAQEAFTKSIAQADEILAKTPDYYSALDAKGLSICGLTICDLRLTIGRREELLAKVVETFKRARGIAPHAGVVKSVLRLFDELVKCDEEGVLRDVRKVIEGS